MTSIEVWDGESVAELTTRWDVPSVRAYAETTSTNEVARTWVENGAPAWAVVLADHQTTGRGRSGRSWEAAPASSVLMSVVAPALPIEDGLPLRVGLAVAMGVERALPTLSCGLKWPNDVWLGMRKVGGVLCEGVGTERVVLGIGLNVSQATDDFPLSLRDSATSLALTVGEPERVPARATVAGYILAQLRSWWTADRPAWQSEWRARDALLNQWVVCSGGTAGVARGIDARGALLVGQEGRTTVTVASGSVRLREAAFPGLGGR